MKLPPIKKFIPAQPSSCDTHPKYEAKHKPCGSCEECWRIWHAFKPKFRGHTK